MTTARNSYATLAEFKAYVARRSLTTPVSSADDAVIDSMLEAASRQYEDEHDHLQYYPSIETRSFDVPDWTTKYQLWLDKELVEIISLTNGDATAITSAQYVLLPANLYPKYGIKLLDSS